MPLWLATIDDGIWMVKVCDIAPGKAELTITRAGELQPTIVEVVDLEQSPAFTPDMHHVAEWMVIAQDAIERHERNEHPEDADG